MQLVLDDCGPEVINSDPEKYRINMSNLSNAFCSQAGSDLSSCRWNQGTDPMFCSDASSRLRACNNGEKNPFRGMVNGTPSVGSGGMGNVVTPDSSVVGSVNSDYTWTTASSDVSL